MHNSNCMLVFLQNGETLIEQEHYAQDKIEARVESLFTLWDQLTDATKAKGRGLAEALSLMSFNRQVDTVHSMITERVSQCYCPTVCKYLYHLLYVAYICSHYVLILL